MKCPVDGTTLLMSDRRGVEIDYCPECRGVWLDRGELDKILSAENGGDDRRDERRDDRRDERRDDRREEHRAAAPPKKKKSFFSEIMEGFGGD